MRRLDLCDCSYAYVVVPLKYLSNFWGSFNLLLINCEVEHDSLWARYCLLTEDNNLKLVATIFIFSQSDTP